MHVMKFDKRDLIYENPLAGPGTQASFVPRNTLPFRFRAPGCGWRTHRNLRTKAGMAISFSGVSASSPTMLP